MPKLSEFARNEKTIELTKGLKITYYDTLLVGETENIVSETENQFKQGMKMLVYLIKEWNLTDDDGKVLEITEETIKKLPVNDITKIIQDIAPIIPKVDQPNSPVSLPELAKAE